MKASESTSLLLSMNSGLLVFNTSTNALTPQPINAKTISKTQIGELNLWHSLTI